MARINGSPVIRGLGLLIIVLLLAGCASYQGKQAYEAAEQMTAEENFDQAVEKYFEAAQFEPGSKTYKLKLMSARTRAAVSHVNQARELIRQGKTLEALAQYRLARGFDPSLEAIASEEQQLSQAYKAQQLVVQGQTDYRDKKYPSARKAALQALQLDSGNVPAQELLDLLDRESRVVAMDGVELDVASAEPLTLRFKNAKIKEVFNVLTKLTDINFIMDEDVRDQPITVFLEKASFAQAMELILQMNGLEKKVLNSKTIIIYPASREKDKQYGDQIIQTFYLSYIDAKKAVNLLRTMLQLRKIYVHEERNALVIRDKPEVIRLAEQILDAADRGDSEVIFDLEIVSVSNGDDQLFGPKLSSYGTSVGFSADGSNIVKGGLESGGSTSGLIQSLDGLQTFYTLPTASFDLKKTLKDSEILASPKIRVRNRQKAKVHIGTREPVVTTTTNDISISSNVSYVDVGVKVDVEPLIQLDGSVETKLRLEVSQVLEREKLETGVTALTISTTNAETVLTLKDGVQTILGGLFEKSDDSTKTTVPILGDIPLIGRLFTNFNNNKQKREILLSITPHIVNKVPVPSEEVATIWSGGEDNLKAGPNFGAFAKPLESEIETIKPVAAPAMKPVVQPIVSGGGSPSPMLNEDKTQAGATASSEAAATKGQAPPAAVPAESEPPAQAVQPRAAQPAQPAASLTLIGPAEATVGQDFIMAVQVDNVASLFSAPLFVNYDPVRLQLVEVQAGGFLEADGQPAVFSSNLKNDVGQVIVGYKQEDGGPGATGSGTLFIMRFKAQAAGSALIDLNRVNFRNPQGLRLDVEPGSATVEIH